MDAPRKLLITGAYAAVLLVIGATDAAITQGINLLPEPGPVADGGESSSATSAPGGVLRPTGPNVFDILSGLDVTAQNTREESLLKRLIPRQSAVEARVILKGDDRLAYFAWNESADAKVYFTALKEALKTSFSSELQDLVDETQEREGKPVRNVLSFLDPAIHTERLLFVRVRQRIYEFHVAPGREAEIQGLMDALTE